MNEWWDGLCAVNRGFYMAAIGFGVIFVWQLLAMLFGLGGDDVDGDIDHGGMDGSHDGTYGDFEHGAHSDALETIDAFKLFSMRSIVTFFTLFTWGTALYMNNGLVLSKSMLYGSLWGLTGMFLVALLLYGLKKLAETGTKDLNTCIGKTGTVYLNIPKNGIGEIKVQVSGVSNHVKARGVGGAALAANTAIKVVKRTEGNVFEVEEVK